MVSVKQRWLKAPRAKGGRFDEDAVALEQLRAVRLGYDTALWRPRDYTSLDDKVWLVEDPPCFYSYRP